jgi:oligogalacturonide transport system substrate-binding protein
MSKRILSCVLVITLLLLAAACQNTQTTTAGNKPVTLRFSWWGTDARHQATLAAIDAYKKVADHVTIEAEYMGFDGYQQKMITQLAGRTAPDIVQFHRDWLPDANASDSPKLAELSTLPEMDLSGYAQSLLAASGSFNGKIYLAPSGVIGMATVFSKTFFEAFNLEIKDQYSWDDVFAMGEAVQAKNKDSYLTTVDIDVLNVILFGPYIAQKTGKAFANDTYELNYTKEDIQEGLQFVLDLYKKGVIEPFGEGSVFVGKMEQNPKWLNNQIGILFDITNGISKYKASQPENTLGVTKLPLRENAVMSGIDFSGNTGFCISAASTSLSESAKFLSWLVNSKEAALQLKDSRGVPATTGAFNALVEAGMLDEDLAKAVEYSKENSYGVNVVSGNVELLQIRKDILQEVIYSRITPAEGAELMVTRFTNKLSEMKP